MKRYYSQKTFHMQCRAPGKSFKAGVIGAAFDVDETDPDVVDLVKSGLLGEELPEGMPSRPATATIVEDGDLNSMTVAMLRAKAESVGVDHKARWTKAQFIEAINEASG